MKQNEINSIKDFTQSRRNLPHWQNPGSVYFITFRTYDELILDAQSKDIIYENIIHYGKSLYTLYGFTIMPDHVHILLQPNEIERNEYFSLSKIMKAIKGYSANQIMKYLKSESQTRASELLIKHIWQSESFDRIIRNDKEFKEKLNYILNNAINKELVTNGYNYKWFWYYGMNDKSVARTPSSLIIIENNDNINKQKRIEL